jgi:hypothetical protein
VRARTTARSAAAICLLAFALPASVSATDDPPGIALDHSQERYTLDGAATTRALAESAGQTCAVSADASGTVACFSSRPLAARADASALRRGALPAGWYALPPNVSRAQLIAQYDAMSAGQNLASPPAQVARRRAHRPRARKADGSACGPANTLIYNSPGLTGTSGSQGFTGVDGWHNYSATFDGRVTSFWNQAGWTARWHDYPNGQGAYYGRGYACRWVSNLDNANMTDGDTANDRFTSWADW